VTSVETAGGCAPATSPERPDLHTPAGFAAAFFVLPVVSLIPVPHAHVPVVAPDAHATAAEVPR